MGEIHDDLFRAIDLGSGVKFSYLPESKWKALSIDVFMKFPFRRETVTGLAIIPRMARRGTSSFPTIRDLSMRLDEMYGAGLGADVMRVGPAQVLRFGIDLPSPLFLGEDASVLSLEEAMEFVWELATKPYLKDGGFPQDRFSAEIEEQRRDILSIINNRPRYAMVRLIEEISKGTDAALPSWGVLDELPKLDRKKVWETWAEGLSTCPVSIYAIGSGASRLGEVLSQVKLEFPKGPRLEAPVVGLDPTPPPVPATPVVAEDVLPGEQTILCVAFHTGIVENDPNLAALLMYDGILGGFPHSKLFTNVREKESLAYFADSSVNAWRGIVTATAGIMDENRDKVRDLILQQVESMRRGEISQEEIDSTRVGLIRRYRSESDIQSAIVRRALTHEIMGGPQTEEELIGKISQVTKDDIVEVACRTKLVAVYLLRAKDDVKGGS